MISCVQQYKHNLSGWFSTYKYIPYIGLVLPVIHTHENDNVILMTSQFPCVYRASYLGLASRAVDSAPRVPVAPPATKAVSVVRLPLLLPTTTIPACPTGSCRPRAKKAPHAAGLKSSSRKTTNKRDMAGTSSKRPRAPVCLLWLSSRGGRRGGVPCSVLLFTWKLLLAKKRSTAYCKGKGIAYCVLPASPSRCS